MQTRPLHRRSGRTIRTEPVWQSDDTNVDELTVIPGLCRHYPPLTRVDGTADVVLMVKALPDKTKRRQYHTYIDAT